MVNSAGNSSGGIAAAQMGMQIATALAAKQMQADRQQGANAIQLLEAADISGGQTGLAGDPLVAKATGLGGLLDVVA